jgi:hypothetical protein
MGKWANLPHEMKTARLKLDFSRVFRADNYKQKEKAKMGYRSTVAYTIRFTPHYPLNDSPSDEELKQCKASFYTFLAEAKVKHSGAFGEDFGVVVDEGNMALNFLAENVKWYETYEDVQVHEDLISLSKEWAEESDVPFKGGNKNIGGIFMRIGEETDDIVQEEWGEADWEWMTLSRQIIVDWA